MWWHGGTGGWWMWLTMMVAMIAFWGVVLWALIAVVRGTGRTEPSGPDPERVLAERFARGEIDEEEYRRRRDVLVASGDVTRARPRRGR